MRAIAWAVGLLGIVGAVALFIVPAKVPLGDGEVNCSAPILRIIARQVAYDEVEAELIVECERKSWWRSGAGLLVGLGGLVAAGALVVRGRPPKPVWDQENYRWAEPE